MERAEVEVGYEVKKESDAKQVDVWVEEIQGFEAMTLPQQIDALKHLLREKVLVENNVVKNEYRFMAELISIRIALFEEELRHQEAKQALEAALS